MDKLFFKELIEKYLTWIADWAVAFVPKFIASLLVLFVGFWIVKRLEKVVDRLLKRANIDKEVADFMSSISDVILKLVVLGCAAAVLGFKVSAILGLLAAAGFAVGLALQGFLGNFASGLMIIFFKPYKIGDWITVNGGVFGKVKNIKIYGTTLVTPGHKIIIVPNGKITADSITNYSENGHVRLEIVFLMAYEDNYALIEHAIKEALEKCTYALSSPAPEFGIESFDTHNIKVIVRPYIHPDEYWEGYFQAHRELKAAMERNGVKMAYALGLEIGEIGG